MAPEAKDQYPTPWATERHVGRAVLQNFVSQALQMEFARLFEGMDEQELEECARSFAWEKCELREGLNHILADHADIRGRIGAWREAESDRGLGDGGGSASYLTI